MYFAHMNGKRRHFRMVEGRERQRNQGKCWEWVNLVENSCYGDHENCYSVKITSVICILNAENSLKMNLNHFGFYEVQSRHSFNSLREFSILEQQKWKSKNEKKSINSICFKLPTARKNRMNISTIPIPRSLELMRRNRQL